MKAIELFPCSGGMAEGFRLAGITFDLAFDKDADACDSYEKNLGHRPIQMDVRDLLRMARQGWRPGWEQARDVYQEIDLLVADPPCTPWSRAGKRLGTEDERDMLTDTADLIALLRPRAYLIGNVPGLNDSTSWHVVQRVIGGLARLGYCVADYVSLDAADYGVPQHRVRPFWFGHLDGPCIRWPAPTHGEPNAHPILPGLPTLQPWVTCRQALGHLTGAELGRPVRLKLRAPGEWSNGGDASMMSRPDEPGRTVGAHEGLKGGQIIVARDRHPPSRGDAPAPTIRADGGRAGRRESCLVLDESEPAKKRPPSTQGEQWSRIHSPDRPSPTVLTDTDRTTGNAVKLDWPWDRPSTVVYADDRIMPPGHHNGSNLSGPNAVILSERAAAILQGFPEGWHFSGKTKRSRWSQLGQAMPIALAQAVASSVVSQMHATTLSKRQDERPNGLPASPDHGGTPGATAHVERDRSPQERGQARQQARELGSDDAAGALASPHARPSTDPAVRGVRDSVHAEVGETGAGQIVLADVSSDVDIGEP